MANLWDISAIAAVGILVAAVLVRHFRKVIGGGGEPGCGSNCCKKPGSGNCP